MKRENKPWRPVTPAVVGWTERGDPLSLSFDDVYYSRDHGREESSYVFVQGNQLPGRWRNWPGRRFCIAETGFGTGLNFLVTWQAWRAAPAPRPDLHYLSIEKYPLRSTDMARALAMWPELAPLTEQLLEQYPGLVPGQHRLLLEQGKVTLDLWWEDVADALPDLANHRRPMVDAWYLDGFAPARNEAMWQPTVTNAVAALSRPNASFSTFTAAGKVGRELTSAGFAVEKVPGYGRKRECLRGRLQQSRPPPADIAETPWDVPAASSTAPAEVLVLGAGLAGCTVAAALARRGVAVTMLDRGPLATEGSGNEQGILYTRLSRRHSALADFSLQSFRFGTAFYRELLVSGVLIEGVDGALCGTFHQDNRNEDRAALAPVLETVPEFVQVLGAEEAGELLGIEQPAPGYWFPRSGWLHPGAVCRALANQPGIHLLENCGEIELSTNTAGWRATDPAGRHWDAPCVVIATGNASSGVAGLDWLPLRAIRGQTTLLPATGDTSKLRAALCHEGYIAPARVGEHCIGATFDLDDRDTTLRPQDHTSNLESLARAVPAWQEGLQQQDPSVLGGRVGFRCASPDYLPLAGPVPDRQAFLRRFAGLRRNARRDIPLPGDYLPGLFLSTGHGSRGLTSTPLAAELLASQICREPPPLSRDLIRALAPARFIIRDLSRNRI